MNIAFKNLYNDYYSKDISWKVRNSIAVLRESGKFLSTYEVFGYEKSKKDKYQLIVDEKAAEVVRRIFNSVLSGKNTAQTAAELNADGILSPMAYKKSKGIKCNWKTLHGNSIWTGNTVYRILNDIRYTGAIIHGKYQVISVGSDKYRSLPKDQWQIYHNRHEAIISMEIYDKVQGCLKKLNFKKSTANCEARHETLLSLIKIRCGSCGFALDRKYRKGFILYCKYKNTTADSCCFKGGIRIEIIEDTVLAIVQKLLDIYSPQTETMSKNEKHSPVDLFAEISKRRKEIERVNNAKLTLYKKYSDGEITREQYLDGRETANKQIEQLSSQVSVLENEYGRTQKNTPAENSVADLFRDVKTTENLTPDIISALIDCIYVYGTERIEIKWKFAEIERLYAVH